MVLHDRALRRGPWLGFCRLPLREAPFAIDVKDQVLWVTAGESKRESVPWGLSGEA